MFGLPSSLPASYCCFAAVIVHVLSQHKLFILHLSAYPLRNLACLSCACWKWGHWAGHPVLLMPLFSMHQGENASSNMLHENQSFPCRLR